jgi:hypothetical protein
VKITSSDSPFPLVLLIYKIVPFYQEEQAWPNAEGARGTRGCPVIVQICTLI